MSGSLAWARRLAEGRVWLAVALLMAALLDPSQGQADDAPVVLESASGFIRATADEQLVNVYKDNQNADFAPWLGRKYSVRQLYDLVQTLVKGRPPKYLSLVVVRQGRVAFLPLAARPMTLTLSRTKAIVEGLRNATRDGLEIHDTVFLMNVWDEGRCFHEGDPRYGKAPRCTVPVFSLIKSWDYVARSSNETDVLLPFFNHLYGTLVFYPWEKKLDKALMRAAVQAQMRPNSTRLWIIQLQHNDPDGKRLLDAGITNNLNKRRKIELADFVTIPDHARYKYLLSADGFTASCRLGKLMGTNSVVLKETTPWIEYYYRSLKPDVHYVPFTKDNVIQVLRSLEVDPGRCQRIAAAAQQFSHTYLSQHAKALYVKRAIGVYNSLFTDLEYFVEGLRWGGGNDAAEGGGLTLVGVLEQMKAFVGRRERVAT